MTWTGAGRPVQASRLSAPCWTSISSPSTTAHPRRLCGVREAGCRRGGRRGPPRSRMYVWSRRTRAIPRSRWTVVRGPTDVQFTSRSAGRAAADRSAPELGGQRVGARAACGSRRDLHARPPRARGRPRGRCRRRRGRAPCSRGRGGAGSAARNPGASVLSAWMRRRRRTSACSRRRSRARGPSPSSASASAASLCGIVTLAPRKPDAPSARTVSANSLRRDRQQLVAPVRQARAPQRGVLHRRRAAVGDRPAEDAEAGAAVGHQLWQVLASPLAFARVVGGDVLLELRVGPRERVRAAARTA